MMFEPIDTGTPEAAPGTTGGTQRKEESAPETTESAERRPSPRGVAAGICRGQRDFFDVLCAVDVADYGAHLAKREALWAKIRQWLRGAHDAELEFYEEWAAGVYDEGEP